MKSLLGKKKVGGLTKKGKLFCIVGLAIPVIHFLFFTILSNGGTILLAFQDFNMDKGDFVWVGLANFEKIPRILTAPGLALQNFTTREPDDSMIEVGIVAVKHVLPQKEGDDRW